MGLGSTVLWEAFSALEQATPHSINRHENCSCRQIPVRLHVPLHIILASLFLKRLFILFLKTQNSSQYKINMRAYVSSCRDISVPVISHFKRFIHKNSSNEAGFHLNSFVPIGYFGYGHIFCFSLKANFLFPHNSVLIGSRISHILVGHT